MCLILFPPSRQNPPGSVISRPLWYLLEAALGGVEHRSGRRLLIGAADDGHTHGGEALTALPNGTHPDHHHPPVGDQHPPDRLHPEAEALLPEALQRPQGGLGGQRPPALRGNGRLGFTLGRLVPPEEADPDQDRKSTRLNSSHVKISY